MHCVPSPAFPGPNGPCGAMGAGYLQAITAARQEIVRRGGFYWQGLNYGYTCEQSVVQRSSCADTLRQWCSPQSQKEELALVYQLMAGENCGRQFNSSSLPGWQQDLANFLLVRGSYAYLGYAFAGCDEQNNSFPFIPELHMDYGVPLANCSETAPGSSVFTREWSKATVQMDVGVEGARHAMPPPSAALTHPPTSRPRLAPRPSCSAQRGRRPSP